MINFLSNLNSSGNSCQISSTACIPGAVLSTSQTWHLSSYSSSTEWVVPRYMENSRSFIDELLIFNWANNPIEPQSMRMQDEFSWAPELGNAGWIQAQPEFNMSLLVNGSIEHTLLRGHGSPKWLFSDPSSEKPHPCSPTQWHPQINTLKALNYLVSRILSPGIVYVCEIINWTDFHQSAVNSADGRRCLLCWLLFPQSLP